MYGEERDRPLAGGGSYVQSGHHETVYDDVSGDEIGYYKLFHLWQNGNSTLWTLKEFHSNHYADFPFAVYTLCFRSEAYVKAETLMLRAEALMAKATPPPKNVTTLVRRSRYTTYGDATGFETRSYSNDVLRSSMETYHQGKSCSSYSSSQIKT